MSAAVGDRDSERARMIRRSAWLLAAIAAAVYVGYYVWALTSGAS
jgi:hypothetical protein